VELLLANNNNKTDIYKFIISGLGIYEHCPSDFLCDTKDWYAL
jgi:hypothetical protein